jgi:AcrR family transcriptional regulator
LAAAQRVLLDRGYHKASVEEIAAIADVAVGSLYSYFGSRDGLFRAVVEKALADDEAAMDEAHDPGRDPESKLAAMREQIEALHRRNPLLSALVLAPAHGGAPAELTEPVIERTRAELVRLQETIAEGVRAGFLRDVDPELASTFLWAAWSGLTALHLRTDALGLSDEQLEDTAAAGFRLLATGLLDRRASRGTSRSRPRRKE